MSKKYTITLLNCVRSIIGSIIMMSILLYFIIIAVINLKFDIMYGIIIFVIMFCMVLYPIYIFIKYYKYDRHTVIIRNDNLNTITYKYIVDNNIKLTFTEDDIIFIEEYSNLSTPLWYYKIKIKDCQNLIIISSLIPLIKVDKNKFKRIRVSEFSLIPNEW